MLSRTASNLYWMARYVERAGNLARVMEVADRMSLMPSTNLEGPGPGSEWHSALITSGNEDGSLQKHEHIRGQQIQSYLLFDADNPSSVRSCFETARQNARMVRSNLTTEVWESINDTWLEFSKKSATPLDGNNLRSLFDWVRERSLQFHGAVIGTMLRDDAFAFIRMGTYLERGDNTARILDVKYHILLPDHAPVGGTLDYYQWASILRAVAAHRSYRHLYRESYRPWLIAELLTLRVEMPRSLVACLGELRKHLVSLAEIYGHQQECHRLSGQMHAELAFGRIQDIFQQGLHEFLTSFIDRNYELNDQIHKDFLM